MTCSYFIQHFTDSTEAHFWQVEEENCLEFFIIFFLILAAAVFLYIDLLSQNFDILKSLQLTWLYKWKVEPNDQHLMMGSKVRG